MRALSVSDTPPDPYRLPPSVPAALLLVISAKWAAINPTSSNADDTIRNSLQMFMDQILKEWGRTKTPYGLDETLGFAREPGVTKAAITRDRKSPPKQSGLSIGFLAKTAPELQQR